MSRDDELALLLNEVVDRLEQRELTLRREGSLRLIENVEAVCPEALPNESEEGFAMRDLVMMHAAVA